MALEEASVWLRRFHDKIVDDPPTFTSVTVYVNFPINWVMEPGSLYMGVGAVMARVANHPAAS
jgi:hypothetical protein